MYTVRLRHILFATLLMLCCGLPAHAEGWSLKDRNGTVFTQSGLHGRWVLVNFWAPWCPPCLQEMPELDALQKQHKNIQVIGVAVMYRNEQDVLDVVQDKKISYPIVLGNEDIASDFGGLTGMPTSFLYSPTGKLLGNHQGPLTRQQVEQAISGSDAAFAH